MSFSCITVTPTSLSSRPKPKQWSFTAMCSSYTDRPSSLPIILKEEVKLVHAPRNKVDWVLQCEGLVELWRPNGLFDFGDLLSLFIRQMWTDEIDFNKRLESLGLGPFEIIGHHNLDCHFVLTSTRMREQVNLNGHFTRTVFFTHQFVWIDRDSWL